MHQQCHKLHGSPSAAQTLVFSVLDLAHECVSWTCLSRAALSLGHHGRTPDGAWLGGGLITGRAVARGQRHRPPQARVRQAEGARLISLRIRLISLSIRRRLALKGAHTHGRKRHNSSSRMVLGRACDMLCAHVSKSSDGEAFRSKVKSIYHVTKCVQWLTAGAGAVGPGSKMARPS